MVKSPQPRTRCGASCGEIVPSPLTTQRQWPPSLNPTLSWLPAHIVLAVHVQTDVDGVPVLDVRWPRRVVVTSGISGNLCPPVRAAMKHFRALRRVHGEEVVAVHVSALIGVVVSVGIIQAHRELHAI